jgi:hypothetical protein
MPALQIDIEARYAKFQDALTAIERQTKKTATSLESSFGALDGVFATLGVTLSAAGFAAMIKDSIDAADAMGDLSKATGLAVEDLAGLSLLAQKSGGDLDSISDAISKLTVNVGKNQERFAKLGITAKDPLEQFKQLSDVFVSLKDDSQRSAVAAEAVGKSWKGAAPALSEGSKGIAEIVARGKELNGITPEMVKQADELNDQFAELSTTIGGLKNKLVGELLPGLNLVTKAMLEAYEQGGLLETIHFGAGALGTAIFTDEFSSLGSKAEKLRDKLGQLKQDLDLSKNKPAVGYLGRLILGETTESLEAEIRKTEDALKSIEAQANSAGKPATPTAVTKVSPEDKAKADRAKKEAEAKAAAFLANANAAASKATEFSLREMNRQLDGEQSLLASRTDFLQHYYQADLIDIHDFYKARSDAQAESLNNDQKLIDKEIRNLQRRNPKDKTKAGANTEKIEELKKQRTELSRKAGEDAIKLQFEQTKAAAAFEATLNGINAELLEQQGLLSQAAAIRFDEANATIQKKLETGRDAATARADQSTDPDVVATERARAASLDSSLAKLGTMRELTVAQATLNQLSDVGARVQTTLSEATDRAQLAAQTGASTELESLRLVSDARLQAVADLDLVAAALERTAASTNDSRMVAQARAMRLEVENLAASADLVRKRFEDAFTHSFDNAFDKLLSGAASLKDVLKGLFTDLSSEITKTMAQDFTKGLFGQKGAAGGIVDYVAGLFGGKPASTSASASTASAVAGAAASAGGATSAAATEASFAAMAITLPPVNLALAGLATAATAAAVAMGAKGVGSSVGDYATNIAEWFGSAKGNIFSGGSPIAFAKGGVQGVVSQPTFFPMKGGRTGLMGEAGPEAIMPLEKDAAGRLSVTMIDERGRSLLLPLTRDSAGKMAVRAQAFAKGGVMGARANQVTSASMPGFAMSGQASQADDRASQVFQIHVTPPAGGSIQSAQQWGAHAGREIARSMKRNG